MRGLSKDLHVWAESGVWPPHKPLLALWAIGRCISRLPCLVPFGLVEEEVGELIRKFGPPRVQTRVDYPFWRLRNDGVWEVTPENSMRVTLSGDAFVRDLRKAEVKGGLIKEVYTLLSHDTSLAEEVGWSLARAHFPSTLQGEVLQVTGIASKFSHISQSNAIPRDSGFRRIVLSAYNFECAICGFAVRFGNGLAGDNTSLAIDSAHIRWHQALGPATVRNGIALCALHHRLFDCGAFTLSGDLRVVVAGSARGSGCEEWLWRFDGESLPSNLRPDQSPHPDYLNWHLQNVFRGRGDESRSPLW